MKEWFKARNIWGAAIMTLEDEDAGRLMKALWNYTMTGREESLPGPEKSIFALMVMMLEQDDDKESEISEKRAEAGAKGGKQRVAALKVAQANEANQANASNKNKNTEEDIEKESLLKERKEKAAEQAKQEERFNQFWGAYPRKEDKAKAAQYLKKIKHDDELLQAMLRSIEAWKKSDQWQEKQYIPHPSTWLNGKRWEDEPPAPRTTASPQRPTKTVVAQQYEQRDYSGVQAALTAEQDDYIARRIAEKKAKQAQEDAEMEEWLRRESS